MLKNRILLCLPVPIFFGLMLAACHPEQSRNAKTKNEPDSQYKSLFGGLTPAGDPEALVLGLYDDLGNYSTLWLKTDGDTIIPVIRKYLAYPGDKSWLFCGSAKLDTAIACADDPGNSRALLYERIWRTNEKNDIVSRRAEMRDSLMNVEALKRGAGPCSGTAGTTYLEEITYCARGQVAVKTTAFNQVISNPSYADTIFQLFDYRGVSLSNKLEAFCSPASSKAVTDSIRKKLEKGLSMLNDKTCSADPRKIIDKACRSGEIEIRGFEHTRGRLVAIAGISSMPYTMDAYGHSDQYLCEVRVLHQFPFPPDETISPCPVDWNKSKEMYYFLTDILVSPGQSMVFFLTKEELIGISVSSGKQVLKLPLRQSKIVMAEWTKGARLTEYEKVISMIPE